MSLPVTSTMTLPPEPRIVSEGQRPAKQGTITYTGLENSHAAIEPDEIDNRIAQESARDETCPTVGSVVRREATNALIGAVSGSRSNDRNRDRRTTRERLADDVIDRVTQC